MNTVVLDPVAAFVDLPDSPDYLGRASASLMAPHPGFATTPGAAPRELKSLVRNRTPHSQPSYIRLNYVRFTMGVHSKKRNWPLATITRLDIHYKALARMCSPNAALDSHTQQKFERSPLLALVL